MIFRTLTLLVIILANPLQPAVAESPTTTLPVPPYDRDAFGRWADTDQDCQNTRHELLIAQSLSPVTFRRANCTVAHGRWYDPYTDTYFTSADAVQVDHLVPLAWAWPRGAAHWSREKRTRFANDPANLFVVEAATNQSKGAQGPDRWLPPHAAFRCQYLLRFNRVVEAYALSPALDEWGVLQELKTRYCDGDTPTQ